MKKRKPCTSFQKETKKEEIGKKTWKKKTYLRSSCYSHMSTFFLPLLGHFSDMLTRLSPLLELKLLPFLPPTPFAFSHLPLPCLPQKQPHNCLLSLSHTLSKWLKLICPTEKKKRRKRHAQILWPSFKIFMVIGRHNNQRWCAHDDHEN